MSKQIILKKHHGFNANRNLDLIEEYYNAKISGNPIPYYQLASRYQINPARVGVIINEFNPRKYYFHIDNLKPENSEDLKSRVIKVSKLIDQATGGMA